MGGHDELTQTEDCHFLSIYTPSRKGARPVLVWIHGGAYLAGSAEEAAYDGSMLAEEGDIVVVAISYRLGAFGYLHDIDNRIVNLGLKDQIAALQWVRENISCFGGDPDKITLADNRPGDIPWLPFFLPAMNRYAEGLLSKVRHSHSEIQLSRPGRCLPLSRK